MSLHPAAVDDNASKDMRPWLSAAMDGQADALDAACQAWRSDAQARSTWHAYHLMGDVMRSSELASAPGYDAAFLTGLRQRLAAEPVVLAPVAAASAPVRLGARWTVPAAVAAGFVVVAGVLVLSRLSLSDSLTAAGPLAAASASLGILPVGNGVAFSAAPSPAGNVIRDPRLDEYLRAHQSARGGLSAALPGSSLRRVDAELPAGAQR